MVKPLLRPVFCLFLLLAPGVRTIAQAGHAGVDSSGRETAVPDEEEDTVAIASYLSVPPAGPAPFRLRRVDSAQVRTLQRSPEFAYANDPDYWKKPVRNEQPSPILRLLLKILRNPMTRPALLIVFILLLGYAIYRLARENAFRWLSRSRNKQETDASADTAAAMSPEDLDAAIRQFSESNNFKEAIRHMYIRLIRDALQKNAAAFSASATNSQIVDAFRDPQLGRDFRFLATAYEYIFYGDFEPAAGQFLVLQQKFNAFHQQLQD